VTLSEQLRDELATVVPRRPCDRLAELSALFHTAGSLHLRGRGEVSVHLDLATGAVARRAFALLKDFGVTSEIRTYRRSAFGRETRYQLHVDGDARALQTLHEAGVVSPRLAPLERPPRRVVGRACCRGAYIRGALLGGGSLSGPRSPHLEVRTAGPGGAAFVADLAAVEGVRMGVVERAGHAAAYAKGRDAIEGVLAAAGAGDTALLLEEQAVVGEARSRANRLANADHANLVRAGRAAHAQLLAARRLERTGELERLSPPLREAAELRLRHPSLSLAELARKCRPPTTKATAHRRLRKIVRLANP
jgi:hypothetical protein